MRRRLAVVVSVVAAAGAHVATGGVAGAEPVACDVSAIQAKAPAGTIITAALVVEASGTRPRYCQVEGHAASEGNTVNFRLGLPDTWNGKFVFLGVGGLGGTMPAVEPGVARGYATASTDTGHVSSDPTWASNRAKEMWGEKAFVWPHGIRVDHEGFLWITDGRARDGRGQQVHKYRRDGTLVMTLGTAGIAGEAPGLFNGPCDVAVAANGDIFVADGHWNARVVKFAKDGTFIKAWGTKGSGPGEFDVPHTIAIDKRGRVLVGDRSNKRIQIFDQDGAFLDQWTHLGSPSGMFIAPDDTLYVVDYNDRKGIFIASAETGVVRQKLDDAVPESVAVDAAGNIYVGETVPGETLTGLPGGNIIRKFTRDR